MVILSLQGFARSLAHPAYLSPYHLCAFSCVDLIALAVVSECYQVKLGEGGLGVAGSFAKQMWQVIGIRRIDEAKSRGETPTSV
jgi:hypothetical protein